MNSPKLTSREIVQAYQRILFLQAQSVDADRETLDRLDDEAISILESLGDVPEEKLEALRAVSLRLEAEEQLIAKEIRVLTQSRRSAARAVERVRGYARDILIARRETGYEPKVKTPSHTFWLTRSRALVGPDHISAWREMGWTKTREEPDKTAATKALKSGVEAEDFRFVERESVVWR